MRTILDLDRWPLDDLGGSEGKALVARCREELRDAGLFTLDALIRPDALETSVVEVAPVLDDGAFTHSRDHNIYFDDEIEGLDPDHPALRRFTTVNHTICGDQIPGSVITRVYEWQPLIDFLAAAMGKPRLYPMADPLGRINVMAYHGGSSSTGTSTGPNSPPPSCFRRLARAGSSSIEAPCGVSRTRTTKGSPVCSPVRTSACRPFHSNRGASTSSRAKTPHTG